MKNDSVKILILPSWYSNQVNPNRGIFFKEQAKALNSKEVDISVLYVDFLRVGQISKSNFTDFLFARSIKIENQLKTYRLNGINIFSLRFELGRKLWVYLTLNLFKIYLKTEGKPDLIYAHSYFSGYVASKIKAKYDIPYLMTEHSSNLFKEDKLLWHDKYINAAFNNADILSAVSHSLKRTMKNKYIRGSKDIEIIPNFIDTDFFKNVAKKKPGVNKTILTIGNLIEVKNQKLLIDAFHQSRLYKKGWILKIGGKGNLKELLKKQIATLGLNEHIELLGELTREHVKIQMADASIFALTSKIETFGVVIIEAMAMGLPILTTKCGGPEMLVTENTGITVENNLSEFTQGMITMSLNFESFSSQAIRNHVETKYSNSAVVKNIVSLIKEILN